MEKIPILKGAMLFLLLFCLSSQASAECTEPTSGMAISDDTVFCQGEYWLDDGIIIVEDGVSVRCEGTAIMGHDNGNGITAISRKGASVSGCRLGGFQVGLFMLKSEGTKITGNTLSGNGIGVSISGSVNNDIYENTVENSSLYGIFIDGESSNNYIYGNIFSGMGFADDYTDSGNSFCIEGSMNEYSGGASGPGCIDNSNRQEDSIPHDDATADTGDTNTGTENVISRMESTTEREILIDVLRHHGMSDDAVNENIHGLYNDFLNTNKSLEIEKALVYNSDSDTTKIITMIRSKKRIDDLSIYEHVPKCIASDYNDIMFISSSPDEVIEADPLFVWHFDTVKKDDVIDLSYKVSGKVVMEPTTVAVSGEERRIEINDADRVCIGNEGPVSVPVGKCRTGKSNWSLYLPFLVIVLFVSVYLFIMRWVKK